MSRRDRTVLVVEDDEDLRELMLEVFSDEGYAVLAAANGREALALLPRLRRPCVVVLDLVMPHMTGAELHAAIRADPALADIPVVVSTSDPTKAPPGVPVLAKPVPIEMLLTAVEALF